MKKENDFKKIMIQASEAMNRFNSRMAYADSGFQSIDKALNYPIQLTYNDYVNRYIKQDIAHRVVKSPVAMTWSETPRVTDYDLGDTAFEKTWIELEESMDVYKVFSQADLLGSLGRFSILYIGTKDNSQLSEELSKGAEISYLSPLSEAHVEVSTWDSNPNSPRFGAPNLYNVSFTLGSGEQVSRTIHWSRVIHIAQNILENKYYGIPALRPIYNRLIGLEKLASGSPEMYWRGARPGYVASTKENVLASAKTIESFKEEISNFVNNLNRYMYAEDLTVSSLAPQVVTPKEHVEIQLKLISAATRIPLRILIGSERGELSSDQDERAWLTYIEERREEVGTRTIIKPFIDRLIEYDILPKPNKTYSVRWDPLVVISEKEKAEVIRLYSDAIKKYDEAVSVRDMIPPDIFAKYILKLDDEVLAKIDKSLDDYLEKESE